MSNQSRTMLYTNNLVHKASFLKQVALFIYLFQFVVYPTYSQVYNYLPINYFDTETNPSILASDIMNNRLQVIHQNSFTAKNTFYFSSLRLSKYFESSFVGVGLSLNNTHLSNNIKSNHLGLGVGYRNVLFNKVYVKLGATYKLVNTMAPSGDFDYYSFKPSGLYTKRYFNDNLNLALSFSSSFDRYYMSFSVLNLDLPRNKTKFDIQFPSYYVVNIGNVMSFFDKKNSEISYSAFSKYSLISNNRTFSHYINLKFNYNFSRRTSLNYGTRIGYAENDYFHVTPFLTFYQQTFAASVSYNFHLDKTNFHTKYYPTSQINLILRL